MNPYGLFSQLKQSLPGNRERLAYEDTFGTPFEEVRHIQGLPPMQSRLLAELEFLIRMNDAEKLTFTPLLQNCLLDLLNTMERQGSLLNQDCLAAEAKLMPLQPQARQYQLIFAAHAHIDMNWMWSWHETVAASLATFKTMLKLMQDYPQFCFSQSQACLYQAVEAYAPEMKAEMQARIKEGRWEVTASSWVENDKNMPRAASLINQFYYARRYLLEHWDIPADSLDLDFAPDSFGHSLRVPAIDRFSGIRYYYHCRGLDEPITLYRFRNGASEVLAYREPYWYNAAVTPRAAIGLPLLTKSCGGLKTGLAMYGVGDHGGGPTRRDIEAALDMQSWPLFPRIRLGTLHDFFKIAQAAQLELPVIEREMNPTHSGCYTSQSRLKAANRSMERLLWDTQLLDAQFSASQAAPAASANEEQFEKAWQAVLFTHFHDILTGSCTRDSREYAMGILSEARARTTARLSQLLDQAGRQLDTVGWLESLGWEANDDRRSLAEGAGPGFGFSDLSGYPQSERGSGKTRIFHLYNTLPQARNSLCELQLWDYPGDIRRVKFYDENGAELAAQCLGTEPVKYWDHLYFSFIVAVSIKAFAYTTIVARDEPLTFYPHFLNDHARTEAVNDRPFVLENDRIKAVFASDNGALISLTDKTQDCECLRPGQYGSLKLIQEEAAGSSGWHIGRWISSQPVSQLTLARVTETGPLRQAVSFAYKLNRSTICCQISLEHDSPALEFRLEINWREEASSDQVPLLLYDLPLQPADACWQDIPGGLQPVRVKNQDSACQSFMGYFYQQRGVILASDSEYGWRSREEGLSVSLLHASTSPDPYPEYGEQTARLWVALTSAQPAQARQLAWQLNHPLFCQSGSVHSGSKAVSGQWLDLNCGSAELVFVKRQETAIQICLAESTGKINQVELQHDSSFGSVRWTDLAGLIRPDSLKLSQQQRWQLTLLPYEVGIISIEQT
ncbi:MAG: glycoside hydrolase family 38 C-terminal domain-containing protein [Oscillospiraceae bacterium]|nr:glycoside hydrolase family 38 C-terminal domain-containing protein [Oscillospiraceae bacterium]